MVKKIGIVSLSRGIIGESFVKHEVDLGIKRLKEYGLEVVFSKHALMGLEYIKNNPKDRASDLIEMLQDDSIDMILCAIGGEDTYRLLPYLFENNELKKAAKQKIFLGYSDSTFNHLMLHKVGINTFYGQAFLSDICEIDKEMMPYTKKYFEELIKTGKISKIIPSYIWYSSREDYSVEAMNTTCPIHKNEGFILLQGKPQFEGEILGGCIDSIYDIFDNTRFEDTVAVCEKYQLFPSLDDWKGKILLLESSEEKAPYELYKKMLQKLKDYGVFDVINGILVGKPADEYMFDEYQKALIEVIDNKDLPILYNINIGHATPRCIIPFGVKAYVDADKQVIEFER